MVHKYPSFVILDKIEIDSEMVNKINFRYILKIPFNNNGKGNILVIMMNPSEATKKISDSTINRVLNYVHKSNELQFYKTLTILNLYPMHEKYSAKLKLHKTKSNVNLIKINKSINRNDKIILGWGRPKGKREKDLHLIKYHYMALQIIKLLRNKKVQVYKINELVEKLYPRHLGRISYEDKLKKCDLEDLRKKLIKKICKNRQKFNMEFN